MNELEKLRHSTAHVLAYAVKNLYPKVKLAIGPPIEHGFYYDFDNLPIEESDLPEIEKEMQKIINQNYKFEKITKTREEAKKILKDEPYKLELLQEIDKPSFYKSGDFIDLCSGPHVNSTKEIKAFKLLKIAGAYWKGDSSKKMLTRIYGTAFPLKKELDDYLLMLEQAEKYNHIKIGKQLELFFFDSVSPGAPTWLPKGMIIFRELEKFWREIHDKDYQEISTPILVKELLFKQSGHSEHYLENMFSLNIEKQRFYLKPMNCPEAIKAYQFRLRSYKELPLRFSEIGRLHRNELSGVLNGLFRVRQITMDDAHIFCFLDQVHDEIKKLIKLIIDFYKIFNLKPEFYLSTEIEKFMGDKKIWKKAESILISSLKDNKINYKKRGKEGAFYGPKIDITIKDSLNREWQMATIQLDFAMPERFKLEYDGEDGRKHTPVIIHRAIFGSFERFIGIITEHYKGEFPLWLSPIQVKLLTFTSRNEKYANKVLKELKENNIRVELDDRNLTVPKKVREAQLQKIPLIITVGDKEEKNNTLAVRTKDGKVKFGVKLNNFIKEIKDKINKKKDA